MKKAYSALIASILISANLHAADVTVVPGKSTLIAAVVQRPDYVLIVINTRDHWVRTQSLGFAYEENEQMELDIVVASTGICPVTASFFHPCADAKSAAEVTDALFRQGVEIDSKFQNWIEGRLKN